MSGIKRRPASDTSRRASWRSACPSIPSFYDLGLRVGARVVPGSVQETATQTLRFHITDGTVNYPAAFRGASPTHSPTPSKCVVERTTPKDRHHPRDRMCWPSARVALRSSSQGLNDAARQPLPLDRVSHRDLGGAGRFSGRLAERADLQQQRPATPSFAMFGALALAVFSSRWALFHHDFNVEYVAAYTSRNLPVFYTWSALYAGQEGQPAASGPPCSSLFGSLALLFTCAAPPRVSAVRRPASRASSRRSS